MMKTNTSNLKHTQVNTTQASPNGGGWEWGLKNPTQTKDLLLKYYNFNPWKDSSNESI